MYHSEEKMIKKKIKYLFIGVGIVIVLGVLSWFTTYAVGDGWIEPRTWTVQVINRGGQPVQGAALVLDGPKYDPSKRYVFQNYRGPNSLTSDKTGLIYLKNKTGIGYGNSWWDLFGIYPMGNRDVPFLTKHYVLISAPGYETVALSPYEIMEKKAFVVTLKKGGVSTRPDR
jgi:hypothetical protein